LASLLHPRLFPFSRLEGTAGGDPANDASDSHDTDLPQRCGGQHAVYPAIQEPGDHGRLFAGDRSGQQSLKLISQNREIFRAALQPFPETGEYPSDFDSPASFSKDSQELTGA
jgi:hypothetical protein